ncbi:hypothetical protein AX774_g4734 [Zancudomyces culisetae]|uniref:Uncharacterized protein n=1 Tax=Zancudomyces culisetae TaxID=1213189 RepID=A0A1R1PL49_ZANCU|nr:hypothetical protein AX774_g4938 [Zancudomyces culisetae]OMH81807.1 hypothetical protein AX774_g4734 [Zancudomyces culisetae]|eukprot:OMH81602.1 hypothetical protein AX774_g4938 [Zancudomyces culisetae]
MFDFQDPWGDSTVEPVQLNYPSRACLDDVVLPPMYDKAYIAASGNDGSVMREDLVKLLNKAELSVLTLEEILILAVPERSGPVSRQSFNLALALISLAQRALTEPVFYDFDEEEFRTQQPDADKPSLIGNEESSINDSWGGKEGKGARSRESFSKKSVDNRDRKFSTGTVKTEESESRRSVEENLSEILSKLKLVDGDDLSQFALEEDPIDVVESAERGGVVFKHINYDITTKVSLALLKILHAPI